MKFQLFVLNLDALLHKLCVAIALYRLYRGKQMFFSHYVFFAFLKKPQIAARSLKETKRNLIYIQMRFELTSFPLFPRFI